MAQWLGQFSGNTHETKVQDLEDSLRQSVATFKATCSDPERHEKAKAMGRLAERLLRARSKLLKSQISVAKERPISVSFGKRLRIESVEDRQAWDARSQVLRDKRSAEISLMEQKHAALLQAGVAAVLREFGMPEERAT
jgi:hypothetical protein